VLAPALAACGGGHQTTPGSGSPDLFHGGVVRIAMQDPLQALDPQAAPYLPADAELFRCCLLRTLYSYRPGDPDRTNLVPDLAAGPPHLSPDRLTWTFHIRRGVHYAPPFQRFEVTSRDIERALLRLGSRRATSTSFESYFDVIVGFRRYVLGDARGEIAGLETPNDHTLVVRLTRPTGDLAYRFSLPATAPIPPSLRDPEAPFGAATGHDYEWGYFLVSTGPYMYANAGSVQYRKPALEQSASGGFEPGISIRLVRNPSWNVATDPIRRPLPSQIDIRLIPIVGYTAPDPFALLRHDQVDLALDIAPDGHELPHGERVFASAENALTYVAMNLAEPPFNDLHVRQAVADGLSAAPTRTFPEPGHVIPDAVEQFLVPDTRRIGGIARAHIDMRRSAYDGDHDGRCDGTACSVSAFTCLPPRQTSVVVHLLDQIGIREQPGTGCVYPTQDPYVEEPQQVPALSLGASVRADYPSPSDFFVLTQAGSAIVANPTEGRGQFNYNISLLGASPGALENWGYPVAAVPNIDDRIDQCLALVGQAAINCWAYADRYVSAKVVAWVPLGFSTLREVGSSRLRGSPVDPFTGLLALERLRGRANAAPPPGMAHPPPQCLRSPIPLGIYRKAIRPQDVSPSAGRAARVPRKSLPSAAAFISGTWTWYAGAPDRNCVYRSTFFLTRHGVLPFEDIHPFTVPRPGIVEFHGSSEILARYRVVLRGRTMRLFDITPDTVRQLVLVTDPYRRLR
jgi:Bacterial extracellular solute-binding proteins, family 5 Middle